MTVALAAVAASMSAVSTSTEHRVFKASILLIGTVAFFYVWQDIDLSKEKGIEALFSYSLKLAVCLAASAAVFVCSATALRLTAFVLKKKPDLAHKTNQALYGALLAGAILGFSTIWLTEYIYVKATEPGPPIMLYFDGEPTHCVRANTSLRSKYRPRNLADRQINLKRGQKVRLEPRVRLTLESFTVRFGVQLNGETKIYLGQSTDFRLLNHRVDEECQW
ncbi:hypothetical protein J7444_08310 [Labrenzia sp. R4_1]|uniref:hypothetical protein n=1 Tax=Labrenzia sp. R4_1 TaxID=2821106 RepID=UPI001ADA4395|nr:hypothetical protein [Labrenzia sp. R4_1]MBO9424721.1 hypothetical protein [Labrenzia sp. R4_1]